MKELCVPLSALQIGETASFEKFLPESRLQQRLTDLGLIEGTKVRCVCKSPTGNPVAYRIRGALIALRKEDSAQIVVLRKGDAD